MHVKTVIETKIKNQSKFWTAFPKWVGVSKVLTGTINAKKDNQQKLTETASVTSKQLILGQLIF